MTACWSKSKSGKQHPYYWCKTRGCDQHRKSIRRADVEGAVDGILKTLQPTASLTKVVKAMFKDAWSIRLNQSNEAAAGHKAALRGIDKKIEGLLDRIVDADQPSVIAAYEKRIAKLEERQSRMEENRAELGVSGANRLSPRERLSNTKNHLTIQGFREI